MAEMETTTAKADTLVKRYMLGAIGLGLVPLPLVDLAAVSSLQLKMLHSLTNLYGVAFSSQRGKSVIAALLGGGTPVLVSYNLTSLVKGIPIYGQAVGMISSSLFSGASTYALGKVFIQHFESGSTFLTFDPQQVRDYYEQQLKQGQEEVRSSFSGIKP